MHDTPLISLIAIGLGLALVGGLVAVRVGLSPIVGYLLAGIAVGPFTPGFVGDATLAPQLAEIGVILLMFGVGMHFSPKDLWAVKGIALPGALGQIVVATAMGVGLAAWWGRSLGEGVVFGLSLSVASTVVLLKALEARGTLATDNGRIAVGWLVVEDLVMVLVLVLLPPLASMLGGSPGAADPVSGSVASPSQGTWSTVLITLGKVALFVVLMLTVVTRIFHWLMRTVSRTGSRELFTLTAVALAIGTAYVASHFFGVSFALGAFFAGVVVNSSDESHRAAEDLQPLQDAFSVLFFVAVGMLFDPAILIDEPWRVIAVIGVIVGGKSIVAAVIVRLLGRTRGTALEVAASLAQIGEFSFILGALGKSLGLLSNDTYALMLAGALLSIVINPLVFRLLSPSVDPAVRASSS
jgi:monovalent cation:H+ antiporter-2, CPA2 family